MAKWLKDGGWYRDRTCDPYHVKARCTSYAFEIIAGTWVYVASSFRKCCRKSWAIIGEELARTNPQRIGG
jgi:hypothetical protein